MYINVLNIKCATTRWWLCIKQHLSNTWSWMYEEISKTEAKLKKSIAYKKACILESIALTCIKTCTEQELFSRIIVTSPRYLSRRVSMRVLWILCFVNVYFSSEEVYMACRRIIQPKNKVMSKFKLHWNMHQRTKCCKDFWKKIPKKFHKLELLASKCIFCNLCYLDYFYCCYPDPKIPVELQVIQVLFTQ